MANVFNARVHTSHVNGQFEQALKFAQEELAKATHGTVKELRSMFDVAFCLEGVDKAQALLMWKGLVDLDDKGERDMSGVDVNRIRSSYGAICVHQGFVLHDKELQGEGSAMLMSLHGPSLNILDHANQLRSMATAAFMASDDTEGRTHVMNGFRDEVLQFRQIPHETESGYHNFITGLVILYSGLATLYLNMGTPMISETKYAVVRATSYANLLHFDANPGLARREALILYATALCTHALEVMEEQDPTEELLLLLDDIFKSFRRNRHADTAIKTFKSAWPLESFLMMYASEEMVDAAVKMGLAHLIWGLETVYNHGKTQEGRLRLTAAQQKFVASVGGKKLYYDPCDYCKRYFKTTSRCSGCKSVVYCTSEHQKKGWKKHRRVCKEVAAAVNNKSLTTGSRKIEKKRGIKLLDN